MSGTIHIGQNREGAGASGVEVNVGGAFRTVVVSSNAPPESVCRVLTIQEECGCVSIDRLFFLKAKDAPN